MFNHLVNMANILAKVGLNIFLVFLVVLISFDVFLRYVVGRPTPFAEELARYCLVWVGFLGASLAIKHGSHISVLLFYERFPKRVQNYCALIGLLLVLFFLGILLVTSLIFIPKQIDQISPSLGISLFWAYLSVPVGTVLMIIQVAHKINELRASWRGEGESFG